LFMLLISEKAFVETFLGPITPVHDYGLCKNLLIDSPKDTIRKVHGQHGSFMSVGSPVYVSVYSMVRE